MHSDSAPEAWELQLGASDLAGLMRRREEELRCAADLSRARAQEHRLRAEHAARQLDDSTDAAAAAQVSRSPVSAGGASPQARRRVQRRRAGDAPRTSGQRGSHAARRSGSRGGGGRPSAGGARRAPAAGRQGGPRHPASPPHLRRGASPALSSAGSRGWRQSASPPPQRAHAAFSSSENGDAAAALRHLARVEEDNANLRDQVAALVAWAREAGYPGGRPQAQGCQRTLSQAPAAAARCASSASVAARPELSFAATARPEPSFAAATAGPGQSFSANACRAEPSSLSVAATAGGGSLAPNAAAFGVVTPPAGWAAGAVSPDTPGGPCSPPPPPVLPFARAAATPQQPTDPPSGGAPAATPGSQPRTLTPLAAPLGSNRMLPIPAALIEDLESGSRRIIEGLAAWTLKGAAAAARQTSSFISALEADAMRAQEALDRLDRRLAEQQRWQLQQLQQQQQPPQQEQQQWAPNGGTAHVFAVPPQMSSPPEALRDPAALSSGGRGPGGGLGVAPQRPVARLSWSPPSAAPQSPPGRRVPGAPRPSPPRPPQESGHAAPPSPKDPHPRDPSPRLYTRGPGEPPPSERAAPLGTASTSPVGSPATQQGGQRLSVPPAATDTGSARQSGGLLRRSVQSAGSPLAVWSPEGVSSPTAAPSGARASRGASLAPAESNVARRSALPGDIVADAWAAPLGTEIPLPEVPPPPPPTGSADQRKAAREDLMARLRQTELAEREAEEQNARLREELQRLRGGRRRSAAGGASCGGPPPLPI
eukprot:TRINITY_DN5732_c0_g1_i2.p1 TRINITY_DN5732_c0_g1~~TRINITY_DN5732_c0_g1_i2.p1  ORF type:complete len:793 (+),score=158.98 TRINITY_DN5732_c0_g1_i2:78-2381(+)